MIDYKQLRAAVDAKLSTDPEFRTIMKRITEGRATFIDTARYSQVLSHILGSEVSKAILNVDDREVVVSHLLHDSYEDINDVFGRVQKNVDKSKGLDLKPQRGEYPGERVEQFVHSLVDPTVEDNVIKRRARAGTETITKSFHDDAIKVNAEFHEEAGLKCYIERIGVDCCQWCSDVAGKYEMKDQPQGIFRRHDNCDCTVIYDGQVLRGQVGNNGRRSKKWVEVPKDAGAAEPVRLNKEQAEGKGAAHPKVFSEKEAKTIEFVHLIDAGMMNDSYYLKGSADIKFDALDNSSPINKKFAKEYRQEYDKFTGIFGELSNLRGVYTAPYLGSEIYGGYNPQSYEITLLGVGGDDGKARMQTIAAKKKKAGEWSTKSVYHTFRHELGHSLIKEHELTDDNWAIKLEKITEIKENIEKELTFFSDDDKMEKKGIILSKYAFESIDEFISECVAEYVNSPMKARSTAKSVVGIILGKG